MYTIEPVTERRVGLHDMEMFLKGLDHARNELKRHGAASFHAQQLERFSLRYD